MQAPILFLILLALVAPVLALIALIRAEGGRTRLRELEDELRALEARLVVLNRRLAQQGPPAAGVGPPERIVPEPPPAAPAPARPPVPVLPRPLVAPPVAPAVAGALALSTVPEGARPAPPPPRTPPPAAGDFATSLGPRLLVGTGALACIVFLGLFVKYAWENNWVGPAGRVLMGATAGVILVAWGLRMLDGRYRPLGQGLSGAGLAGLYVSAFGAHGFYDLISREWAGLLMAAITVNAVLLAARLDARLLATLAWVGGYLTPVMLSTGEDRALALFLYVALIDAGALVLDRYKPWPETALLAGAGTLLLYVGWFSQFYTPLRFGMAAFGLVLFTALFAVGLSRKSSAQGTALVVALSTIGLVVLAGTADRPLELIALSLTLGVTAFTMGPRLGVAADLFGLAAAGLPFLAWAMGHYRPASFGIAAAWVAAVLLLTLVRPFAASTESEDDAAPAGGGALGIGLALAAAAVVSAALAASTDEPRGLAALLLAQAGIAILARSRWAWAELTGVVGAALTSAVWLENFFKDGRQGEAWLIAFPAAGAYLLSLVVRGLVARRYVDVADVFAHLGNATLVWITLFYALYDTAPGALALSSVALAALYLALGLVALHERPEAALQVRTTLGLAAVFLTIAIPVRLGLHGITLAWALEGVLLLALGLRHRSPLARAGGYGVLVLAALRLLARHTPWQGPEAFTPVLNPGFGTWLAVIAALAAAALLARRDVLTLDRMASIGFSIAALALLFSLLTGETTATFEQAARVAHAHGDQLAEAQARLRGRFALSLLWTVFATALLAGGLGLRSRPLFYAAYGLFAVTALKVVFVDTATLQTLYRMLSFLALGLLLLAGAYLNLRFRERLLPREEAA
jgi:uncharacterized membrane protein